MKEQDAEYLSYRVPAGVATARTVVKKSRFEASVARASGRREAADFIESARKAHPSADHNCYAFSACAPGGTDIGFGDDGEVSGTAGRPMLAVLERSGIGEIAAVVSRYFGGVKLGPGGLARAYAEALRAALAKLPLKEHVPVRAGHVVFSYAHENPIRALFEKAGVSITGVERAERVRFRFSAPLGSEGVVEQGVASVTRGKSELVWTR